MDLISDVLLNMRKSYQVEKEAETCVTLRADISSAEEAEIFVKRYSDILQNDWIVHYTAPMPERIVMHKAWLCQHSKKNKSKNKPTLKNANCTASVNILIKKNNRHTRRNDKYLTLSPPLVARVTIQYNHSHHVGTADSLRLRRVSEQTKETFFDYFSEGMTPSEAKSLHETKLLLHGNAYELLADASVNPTSNQVYHIHSVWREGNFGPAINPHDKLQEKIAAYEKDGAYVHMNENCEEVEVEVDVLALEEHRIDIVHLNEEIKMELDRIAALSDETSVKAYVKFLSCLKRINNANQINSLFFSASEKTRKGGCIKVQPTALSQRKEGVTRDSKRIPAGRPPLNAPSKRRKRPHSLTTNVMNNVPNAILHGSGH